jgi:hypothetical protein
MSDSAENETRGLHALGNPDVEYRSADRGPTGESPIGGAIWGRVMARGTPSGPRQGMGGAALGSGKEILRRANSR